MTVLKPHVPNLRTIKSSNWLSTIAYSIHDIVSYNKIVYISLVSNNLNNIPSTSPAQWQAYPTFWNPTTDTIDVDQVDATTMTTDDITATSVDTNTITFTPQETVGYWGDIRVPMGSFKKGTISPPGWTKVTDDGAGSVINTTVGNSTISTVTRAINNNNKTMFMDWFNNITDATKTISSLFLCRLWRDTSVADNVSGSVALVEFDFHYQKNSPGSTQETIK